MLAFVLEYFPLFSISSRMTDCFRLLTFALAAVLVGVGAGVGHRWWTMAEDKASE